MKICYIMKYPPWDKRAWGGEDHIFNIALEVSKNKNEVTIINSSYEGYKYGICWKKVSFIAWDRLRHSFLIPKKKDLFIFFNSSSFDIVHYYDICGFPVERMKSNFNFRTVFSRFSDPISAKGYKNKFDFLIHLKLFFFIGFYIEKYLAKKANLFVTTSNNLRKFSKSNFNLNRTILKINRGVNISRFKFSKYPSNYNIFVANRLDPEKNTFFVLKAMPKIITVCPNAKLYIAGDGVEKKQMIEFCKNNNLNKQVIFLGKISSEKMIRYYKKCSVYINCSVCEGWGATVTEAMAIGRPIVAARAGGYLEQVIHNYNGFLIKPTILNISKSLIFILNNKLIAKKMGLHSRKIVDAKLTFKIESQHYVDNYKKIMLVEEHVEN